MKTKTESPTDVRFSALIRNGKRNLEWAERELMKMQDEETNPQLRALWSTAARIARERIALCKSAVPNDPR